MFEMLIVMLSGMFWMFRVVVALMETTQTSFPVVPLNTTVEIILLFITFMCIVLIAKRKMIGAIVYLIAHCAYFGVDAYQALTRISVGQGDTSTYLSLFISLIAVLLPLFALMNLGLNTGKKGSLKNRNTDWYYGTTDYDRNMDDRADKNQYKF